MKSMELWEFCREYPLDEKIFIVPSRAIGLQMINDLSSRGHCSLNLKPITLRRLAFEICEEYIHREGKLIIDDILGSSLILEILGKLQKDNPDNFFFKKEFIDIDTAEEVYKVIMELKHNDLKDYPREKNLDLIYEAYEASLKELNAMDYQDVIKMASELKDIEDYRDKKIGLAYNIEFENLERNFLEKLIEKGGSRIIMPVKNLADRPKNYYFNELDDHLEEKDKNINFYKAYGSKNEIGYIIEDIFKKNIPLDQVVIAYTNSKYADLLNIEFESKGISIGFGQGLGIESSSIYRFLSTIFDWAESYYSINHIRPIFINGDIRIDLEENKGQASISPSSMYEELVRSKVLYGRENYGKILSSYNGSDYSRVRKLWLRDFFNDLFYAIPEGESLEVKEYVKRLVFLIDKYVRNFNKYDGAAKIEIYKTLDRLESLDMEVSRSQYFNMILSYIRKNRILRSQTQPGHVFATNYKNAGYSGRKHLYLIGLDSDSLSNKTMESPILLDSMKSQISGNLAFAKESYKYKKYKIRELLTGDFETISVGYSDFDTLEVKAKSPSQIYTELRGIYNHRDNKNEEVDYKLYGRDLVRSGTAMEVLADCSRKAYLRYKMKLEAIEDVEIRIDRWLDGLNRGIAVHRILNKYFDLDDESKSREILWDLSKEVCREISYEISYAIEEVYLREREEIFEISWSIVKKEEEDNQWEVLINELSFGDYGGKDNHIFGKLGSQDINLGDFDLTVSGAIDRVDINKLNPNLFRIIDYKTGSMDNFEKKLRRKSGRGKNQLIDYSQSRKFQHYIYARVLEKILATRKDLYGDPKIGNFIYMFPGDDDKSLIDIDLSDDFKEEIERRMMELLDMDIMDEDKKVIYDPEDNLRCKYCEYRSICMPDKDISQIDLEVY